MTTTKQLRAAVIGASGYTGSEMVRLLHAHPEVEIATLVASSNAGKALTDLYPHMAPLCLPVMTKTEEVDWENIDVAFGCLPHGTSQKLIAGLPKHLVVIDLSADFRLHDTEAYATWYHAPHAAPDLQKEAVYGLSEHYTEAITHTNLIACPGCYPTATLLPILPLLAEGLIKAEGIIVDAKSGISGAGRSVKLGNLYTEIHDSVQPYALNGHRHIAEIKQEIANISHQNPGVTFVPQLVPMARGILATLYVQHSPDVEIARLNQALSAAYATSPFVHMVDIPPSTRQVCYSNNALIHVAKGQQPHQAILICAIDNLIKGASGQALQNMNIRFGFPETLGLEAITPFP